MAAGSSYPIDILNPEQSEVRLSGYVSFTDSTNQPAATASGIASASAYAASGLTGSISATRYVGGTADVAPTTGAHLVGDFVISATGRVWVCTVAATPGTWVEVGTVTSAPKASPTFTGTVTVPAAAAATSATKLADLSSYLTITSGTLPNTGAWVSGTAKQNPVSRQITVNVEVVTDATNNAATCVIGVSSDNSTYTTVATPGVAAAVNNLGAVTTLAAVTLPNAWWIKLTLSHTTVAASIYY